MSNPIYEQKSIRCEIDITGGPRAIPFDRNTGEAIAFWRGQRIAIQVAVFTPDGVCVDLSNLAALVLRVFKNPTDVVPVINKVLGPLDITPTITRGSWVDGTAQQATFLLEVGDTDLNLDGGDSAQYFINIRGVPATGGLIDYAGGPITVFNPGTQLPILMPGVVSYHEQTAPNPGDVTVSPTSVVHKEIVNITGPARELNILIDPIGLIPGSEVKLILVFPDLLAGIVIHIFTASLDGAPVDNYTTDAFQPNACWLLTLGSDATFKIFDKAIPAYQTA